MGAILIVQNLPAPELSHQVRPVLEASGSIKLLGIGLVTRLHLAVSFRACCWNVLVGDLPVGETPGEQPPGRGIVVRLVSLDRERQVLTDLPEEVQSRSGSSTTSVQP